MWKSLYLKLTRILGNRSNAIIFIYKTGNKGIIK